MLVQSIAPNAMRALLAEMVMSTNATDFTSSIGRKDFFISYTSADRAWAEWIAWTLEEAGYSTIIQAWDFRPGQNFVELMDRATCEAERTIAVLSRKYFDSAFARSEWQAAFRTDPAGRAGKLLAVRVEEFIVPGLLGQVIYIDLVALREDVATEELLIGVRQGRSKPNQKPAYPIVGEERTIARKPVFPTTHVAVALATGAALGVAAKTVWDALAQTQTNSLGMAMRLIPAGSYWMGSRDADRGNIDEQPRHRVTLPSDFYLGVCPVTQDEYVRVVGQNPSKFRGDGRRPVEQVSWRDAVEYCNRLSQLEGLSPYYRRQGNVVSIFGGTGYRLPMEAEWEYACRAGNDGKWCFGDAEDKLCEYAWYDANSGNQTQPVGSKKPNAWGLHDMHGNVWEWCWDWFGAYDTNEVGNSSPRTTGTSRVVRGGNCRYSDGDCRSAIRGGASPFDLDQCLGFRVARSRPRSLFSPGNAK